MNRIIFIIIVLIAAIAANAQTEELVIKNGKITVVKVDTTKTAKSAEKVGDFPLNGKTVTVYKGARGGYFYYTGKTAKNGKPEKKYIKNLDKQKKQ